MKKIEEAVDLMGERIRGYASQAKHQDLASKRGFAGVILNRNTAIVAGSAIVTGVMGNRADALVLWLFENFTVIMPIIEANGRSFMGWMGPIMQAIQQSGGSSYDAFRSAYDKIQGTSE